ncbi:Gfo/Idh/MocA family oxidoreductase [Paenibacillus thiaminolyticus]|uniref:Gfo/Idh/MocA family protein n=1 Tax=Paenibacillus thiaminolyticus TaxID=49283 RepID=UPI0035A591D8
MKYKIIQAGLGAHGYGIAQNVIMPSTDFSLVGLVDIDPDRLKQGAAEFQLPETSCYSSYEKAFQECEADAVFVAVISPLHYDICKCAMEHSLHVLVEKPFTVTLEEAKEIVSIADQRHLKIMVNQNYRYLPNVMALKNAIDQEIVGKPQFAVGEFYYMHDGKPYQREMDRYMLMEMAVHHIDMIRYMFDSNVDNLMGKTWNVRDSGYAGEPNAHAMLELENGLPVFYTGSLLAKGMGSPSWEGCWRVQCKQGSLHLADMGQGYGVYAVDEQEQIKQLGISKQWMESVDAVLAEFASSIREDRQPLMSGADNLHTMATLLAMDLSSKQKQSVKLSALFV